MRLGRLLALAVFVLLLAAVPARAQTTTSTSTSSSTSTSTSSSTSTTVAGGGLITACSPIFDGAVHGSYIHVASVTLSASYQVGGERFSLTANTAQAGACICGSTARIPTAAWIEPSGGYVLRYVTSTHTIMARISNNTSALAEVAEGTNLSAVTAKVLAFCQ